MSYTSTMEFNFVLILCLNIIIIMISVLYIERKEQVVAKDNRKKSSSEEAKRFFAAAKEDPMASPKRYFINNLADFNGDSAVIQKENWFNFILDTSDKCARNQPANSRNADGGLYVGVAGLAYMYYSLSQSDIFTKQKDSLLNKSLDIIKFCEDYLRASCKHDKTEESGFLLGNAGIYAVGAAIYLSAGDRTSASRCLNLYSAAGDICTPTKFVDFGGDEFLVGRAGYLAGALWLNKIFGQPVIPIDKINHICSSTIEYGRWHSKKHNSPCPLMYAYYDTEYLGAAHGLSSILQMLLSCDEFVKKRPDAEKDIKESVDYLLSLQTSTGNFPCAMDELGSVARSEANELVHWCHGAPGVVYLMAKAYLHWGDPKYLDSCLKAGELVWKKGLLKKGPGICHGVGGNGYVFLLLYRLTGDQRQLFRANEFAEFLMTNEFKKARTPDAPYSLYEGWAGTLCFLSDLLTPEKAAFPFMDVF